MEVVLVWFCRGRLYRRRRLVENYQVVVGHFEPSASPGSDCLTGSFLERVPRAPNGPHLLPLRGYLRKRVGRHHNIGGGVATGLGNVWSVSASPSAGGARTDTFEGLLSWLSSSALISPTRETTVDEPRRMLPI